MQLSQIQEANIARLFINLPYPAPLTALDLPEAESDLTGISREPARFIRDYGLSLIEPLQKAIVGLYDPRIDALKC